MSNLTKTQTVIVQLLSDGNSAGEVAAYRCRSLGTIRKHIDLAKERMGARSTGHLIKLAVQQGLINSIFVGLIVSQPVPAVIHEQITGVVFGAHVPFQFGQIGCVPKRCECAA